MQSIMGKTMALLALAGGLALAADQLPARSLPLSKVLAAVEQAGLTSIVEANFDDGVWEVEGFRGDRAVEVHVDPLTGKLVHEHPDQIVLKPGPQAKSALQIATQLEGLGYVPVELEWEGDHWKAEAFHSQVKKKLHLAADSGKVLSERLDD